MDEGIFFLGLLIMSLSGWIPEERILKMKSFKKTLFCSLCFVASLGMASCSKNGSSVKPSSTDDKDKTIHFVAVTDTSFDAEVTVGKHKYRFDLALDGSKSAKFTATCTGKGASGGGSGGPGGSGQEEKPTSQEPEETDFTKYDFSFNGSWELEAGYGYKITLQDAGNSVIHTDFNKTQGRHQFYYNVATDEGSSVTLFQYKDSQFAKTLASDYKTWDERDSVYAFSGKAVGNNSSVATAYLYAHKDGTVLVNEPNGSGRKVTMGLTWKNEGDDFVLMDKDKKYVAFNSLDKTKDGYRVSYNSVTYFCSKVSSMKNSEMTNELFDGKTLYQFTGSYTTSGPDGGTKEVFLNLTDYENGLYLYTGDNLTKKGTYEFKDGKFSLQFEGEEKMEVSKNEEGNYVYSFQITTSSFFGTSTVDVVLTYTPKGA